MKRLALIAALAFATPLAAHDGEVHDDKTEALCWVTLWRLQHADTTGARGTLHHLADSDRSYLYAACGGPCVSCFYFLLRLLFRVDLDRYVSIVRVPVKQLFAGHGHHMTALRG